MDRIPVIKLKEVFHTYPYARDFFTMHAMNDINIEFSLRDLVNELEEDLLEDIGINREDLEEKFITFIKKMEELKEEMSNTIQSITIIGGKDKGNVNEDVILDLHIGDVISIVGPTGSGKSRLLEDIECLAQHDTPTKRQVLLNGEVPSADKRFSIENKLVAQLSQNMNFVMDLSVEEFIRMHAESRQIQEIDEVIEEITQIANKLAGETFTRETPLTELSGGQSRALMIADTALLSTSPIVLIDEIENAGIDRKRAIELLVKEEKIVLISTHDPILALLGNKRVVIKNGGIHRVIIASKEEKQYIKTLEKMDQQMTAIRNHLRTGGIIDESVIHI